MEAAAQTDAISETEVITIPFSIVVGAADEPEPELVCYMLSGPAGSGKTTKVLQEAASVPGRYLLAVPRTGLVDEHAARLRTIAAGVPNMSILAVHSDQGVAGCVGRRVSEALRDRGAEGHAVILITHAALLDLEGGALGGWHVRIDEVPDGAIAAGAIGLGTSYLSMSALYDLAPGTEPGWSRVMPRPGTAMPKLSRIVGDVAKDLVDLHRLAASPGRLVEIDLTAWKDAAATPNRTVRWRSIWCLAALRGCASLAIAAASYVGSLIDRATTRAGGVRLVLVNVGSPRTGQPQIRINWFTQYAGSTSWWETDLGSACLVAISRYLEAIAFDGYWTCNRSIRPYFVHRFPAEACAPRIAGTNALRHHTACAVLYSAKALPGDAAILDALDIDRAAVCAAREDEDIYQFVTRGRIREPDYTGIYSVFLYSFGQAERLRDRLIVGGYVDVNIEPVEEAGILEIVRPVQGAEITDTLATETAAETRTKKLARERARGRRRRAETKAAAAADGSLRLRGRPRKIPPLSDEKPASPGSPAQTGE